MGLAAAYELGKAGYAVTLFERDDQIGGMSAFVDFAGTRIERYYHFICRPDVTTFQYLREFGLIDRLHWVETKMGFYYNGTLYDWGHPFALLRFPNLGFIDKARYALHVMRAKGIRDWRPYDALSSTEWLQRWIGACAYDVLAKLVPLQVLRVSGSAFGGLARYPDQAGGVVAQSLFRRLGYLEGGSEVLLEAVAERIQSAAHLPSRRRGGGDYPR